MSDTLSPTAEYEETEAWADEAMDFYADQWAAAYDEYVAACEVRADMLADEHSAGSQS